MSTPTQLGIWMDHSSAHLMEVNNNTITTKIISSKFSHEVKEHSLSKNENLMHNKEQQEQAQYYKQLASEIKKYKHVLVFGPTDAKVELVNTMKDDQTFNKIEIELRNSDKLSENQQHAFVRDYFSHK